MKDHIKTLIKKAEKIENEFSMKGDYINETSKSLKERALIILASLKRAQDDPVNEDEDDVLEDLISTIITIVGKL